MTNYCVYQPFIKAVSSGTCGPQLAQTRSHRMSERVKVFLFKSVTFLNSGFFDPTF